MLQVVGAAIGWSKCLLLGFLFVLGCVIAGFLGVGFGHVFSALGFSVVAAFWIVIDARIQVHPNHAGARRAAGSG